MASNSPDRLKEICGKRITWLLRTVPGKLCAAVIAIGGLEAWSYSNRDLVFCNIVKAPKPFQEFVGYMLGEEGFVADKLENIKLDIKLEDGTIISRIGQIDKNIFQKHPNQQQQAIDKLTTYIKLKVPAKDENMQDKPEYPQPPNTDIPSKVWLRRFPRPTNLKCRSRAAASLECTAFQNKPLGWTLCDLKVV